MLTSVDHEKSFITLGPCQKTLPADLNQIAQKLFTPHLLLEVMCDVPVNIFSVILRDFFIRIHFTCSCNIEKSQQTCPNLSRDLGKTSFSALHQQAQDR